MALTIYYDLQSRTSKIAEVRRIVRKLRQKALDIPFALVTDVFELHGKDTDFKLRPLSDPLKPMLVQVEKHLADFHDRITPEHIIGFTVHPGEGCELAHFGLAFYSRPRNVGVGVELTGWSWSAGCMTQWANAPACGGVENFIHCHTSVVKLLDDAEELGILEDVEDEGGYWNHRDKAKLIQEAGEWSQQRAGFVGDIIRYSGLDFGVVDEE